MEDNDAFLGVNAMTTAQQTRALRALADEACIAILTENATNQPLDVRQLASLVGYYGHLQRTKHDGRRRSWTTWLNHRQSYVAVDAVSTGMPFA